ncbi:hypothetical protein FISHEDRAFT_74279 [Fistulina hepatica ATCC 64428]|uniref:Uncharacterized protein n=1 Tax=Fistulina hepatica ATCC 64428 TaxID=1128425 RepID=A0A0D7AD35_9AGAR|nr:hypothetical protein FISHEDRAFT_74279 [Fistulina hepatica ATCC 64428]
MTVTLQVCVQLRLASAVVSIYYISLHGYGPRDKRLGEDHRTVVPSLLRILLTLAGTSPPWLRALSHPLAPGPVLAGENNFTIWKICIKAKLASAKVAGIAYGIDTRESITAAVAAATAASISAIGSSVIQPTNSWDIRDQKAHGIIVEHLSDSLVMALVTENQ